MENDLEARIKEKFQAEYEASESLQREFKSFDCYWAFVRHEATGQAQILGSARPAG